MKEKILPILLGTDANVYGMARSFYEQYGIKSIAVGRGNLVPTRYSNIVKVITIKDLIEDEIFVKSLIEIANKYIRKNIKLILISCGDGYTSQIINNYDKLKKYYIIPYINQKLQQELEDKETFYKICEKHGLDYPKTFICTYKNKNNFILPFSFPVAIKPSNSISYLEASFNGKRKSYKAENKEEMRIIIDRIYNSTYKENLIIQDFIPGDDDTMYVLNCYSNSKGKVKMMCLGNCILEDYTPKGIGNYNAIISTSNNKLYQKIQKFLEEINYVGYSNFDLKYDFRDKKFKLFEINIRQGRSSYFVTASGCNLSKYLVEDYIYNLDKEPEYNRNEYLWLAVPKFVLKKYVNKETYIRAKELLDNKKYSYSLLFKGDFNIKRYIIMKKYYYKSVAYYKKYFKKRGA